MTFAVSWVFGPEAPMRTSCDFAGFIAATSAATWGESVPALLTMAAARLVAIPPPDGTHMRWDGLNLNNCAEVTAACRGDWLPDVAQPAMIKTRLITTICRYFVLTPFR